MKSTNICKIKPNETKSRFRPLFTPSSQEKDRAYSAARGACTGTFMTEVICQKVAVKYYMIKVRLICHTCKFILLITNKNDATGSSWKKQRSITAFWCCEDVKLSPLMQ